MQAPAGVGAHPVMVRALWLMAAQIIRSGSDHPWPEDVTVAVNLSPLQIRAPGAALGIILPLFMLVDVATLKPYWGKWHWPSAKGLMIGAVPGCICCSILFSVSGDTNSTWNAMTMRPPNAGAARPSPGRSRRHPR